MLTLHKTKKMTCFHRVYPIDDHSRIILKEKWNENDNDYVNANYIKVNSRLFSFLCGSVHNLRLFKPKICRIYCLTMKAFFLHFKRISQEKEHTLPLKVLVILPN